MEFMILDFEGNSSIYPFLFWNRFHIHNINFSWFYYIYTEKSQLLFFWKLSLTNNSTLSLNCIDPAPRIREFVQWFERSLPLTWLNNRYHMVFVKIWYFVRNILWYFLADDFLLSDPLLMTTGISYSSDGQYYSIECRKGRNTSGLVMMPCRGLYNNVFLTK